MAAMFFLAAAGTGSVRAADEDPVAAPEAGRVRWVISPLVGYDRNELEVRGPRGQVSTETDTAPVYGFFATLIHPNWVVNDFPFWSDVNDTEVSGNLFFANYYDDAEAAATWNVGAGYLWHGIEPEGEEIEVHVPMVKAGPVFRIAGWGVTLNPYLGYAWERVDTRRAFVENDSWLYGLTAGWRWRMLGATVNYYYQDSQDLDEDFQVVRARVNVGVTSNWSALLRVDYMEHSASTDTMVLAGPAYRF
jgi:hypothetical protein